MVLIDNADDIESLFFVNAICSALFQSRSYAGEAEPERGALPPTRQLNPTSRLVISTLRRIFSHMTKFVAITLSCLFGLAGLSMARAESTPLEQSMKRMATAYHALEKDLKTPDAAKKADYVALAATMKTEAVASRALVPKKVTVMPTEQKAPLITAYQKSIDDLTAEIDTLSTDLQAAQWDAAKVDIAKLKSQMIDGHKKFRIDKKEHGAPAAPAPASTAT